MKVLGTRVFWAGSFVAAMAAGCAAGRVGAQDAGPGSPAAYGLEYAVGLSRAATQMIDVSVAAPDLAPGTTHVDFVLPAWRPGKYAILDTAGTVRDVRARSGRGEPLAVEKTDKQTWRVAANGEGGVVLDYRVYANSLGDRTRHADDTHAFISPSSVMMYVPERRERPVRVRIDAPDGWQVATGLSPEGEDPRVLAAADYDVLVDSPLEIGLHEAQRFEVDGVPHEIVVWTAGQGIPKEDTEGGNANWDRMPEDFAAIVREQREIFGDLPYERYVYLVHAYPGGSGGTEHLNSTAMGTSPKTFEDEKTYDRFLGLVSHEMFHTWNVKRFRPAGLVPYDYTRENYTDLLWVAEGVTSYYDDLTLARAGLMGRDDYLKRLGDSIDALRRRPGAAAQSLAESSFDAWIKFNRPTPDSVNSTVSFYDKGALASLVLDMEIRRRTEGRASLDDAMRTMYRRFPLGGPGYTTADLIAVLNDITGSRFEAFFEKHIAGVEPLDFESALSVVGLELTGVKSAKTDGGTEDAHAGEESSAKSEPRGRAYIGLKVEQRDGLAAVTSVLADGPAYEAGVNVADLIVAMNGRRLRSGDLEARVERMKPGDEVRLTLLRHDELREVRFKAGEQPDGKWKVRRIKEPTPAQRAAYESWLSEPWDGKRGSDDGGNPDGANGTKAEGEPTEKR